MESNRVELSEERKISAAAPINSHAAISLMQGHNRAKLDKPPLHSPSKTVTNGRRIEEMELLVTPTFVRENSISDRDFIIPPKWKTIAVLDKLDEAEGEARMVESEEWTA